MIHQPDHNWCSLTLVKLVIQVLHSYEHFMELVGDTPIGFSHANLDWLHKCTDWYEWQDATHNDLLCVIGQWLIKARGITPDMACTTVCPYFARKKVGQCHNKPTH